MDRVLTPKEGSVIIENDKTYGSTGKRDLKCDIYSPPDSNAPNASILLLHGGGWMSGDRKQLKPYAIQLARYGFVCVCAEYRLIQEATWPAQIYDVKAALRWMRANAQDLNINPEKICVSGNSAGGHLSLVLAGSQNIPELEGSGGCEGISTHVAAVCGIYAPAEIRLEYHPELMGALLGKDANEDTEKQASPSHYLSKDFPPTLLVHGSEDELVPPRSSFELYARLKEEGVASEIHVYDGMPHAFDLQKDYYRQITDIITLFFDRHVVNPRPFQMPNWAG